MPSPELRALLLLLALAVAGQGVRYLVTRPGDPPGGLQLLGTSAGSPLAQRDSAVRQGRQLAPDERIDVDVAPAAELARLPRVGPRLAKVIVADRETNGSFGNLQALDRVPGIGPGLLKAIGPHVVFGGAGGQGHSRAETAAPLNINSATDKELDALPGIGPAKARAIVRYREEYGPFPGVEALAGVPGISRALLAKLKERVTIR